LHATLTGWMDGVDPAISADSLLGIAAPHVSPDGGYESYRAAYAALAPQLKDRTFVVLGTSHYGEPERFGLTRKPFITPLGTAETDCEMADRLAAEAGPAANMEDYCHAVEHSIEFQVLFLQHVFGPDTGHFGISLIDTNGPALPVGNKDAVGNRIDNRIQFPVQ
jgi:AmmeMemoRadiSam system protein B